MLRHPSALPFVGRVLLAASLCLLAVAFAMEAKMAWYGPPAGAARSISAAKAMPADIPAATAQRPRVVHPAPPESALMCFAVLASVLLAAACASKARLLQRDLKSMSVRPPFSPPLFFRPPPTLA